MHEKPRPSGRGVCHPCEFCDGIHIGRAGKKPKHLKRMEYGLRKLNRILASVGFQAKAPEAVKQRMVALREQLRLELEEYYSENQMFQDADLEGNAYVKGGANGAPAFQSKPSVRCVT